MCTSHDARLRSTSLCGLLALLHVACTVSSGRTFCVVHGNGGTILCDCEWLHARISLQGAARE
jgi:hypothetical protein